MTLIIGGFAQGKREWASSAFGLTDSEIVDGESCPLDPPPAQPAIDRLHLLIRRLLMDKIDPALYIDRLLAVMPDRVLIADEISCGVVPLDRFEREWREAVGRICCGLAARSDQVIRIFAGIPTMIKGERI